MANKPFKKGSTSLTIEEMSVTITMRERPLVWAMMCKDLVSHCCLNKTEELDKQKNNDFSQTYQIIDVTGQTITRKSEKTREI